MKFYWSDWPIGHPCHLRITDLYRLLLKLELKDYEFRVRDQFHHSSAHLLHPLNSPYDQHTYDPKVHPPKEDFELDQPIYHEFFCYVRLRPLPYWDEMLDAIKGTQPVDPRTFGYKV